MITEAQLNLTRYTVDTRDARYRDVLHALVGPDDAGLYPDGDETLCRYCDGSYGVIRGGFRHDDGCPVVQGRALLATEPAILGDIPAPFSDGEIAQRKEWTARARVAVRAYLEEEGVTEPIDLALAGITPSADNNASEVRLTGYTQTHQHQFSVYVPHAPARDPLVIVYESRGLPGALPLR